MLLINRVWTKPYYFDGKEKDIKVFHGDIQNLDEEIDLLVCSAFKGHYGAFEETLIGNLNDKYGISVEREAENPELDCREAGNYWISKELEEVTFKRLACIEILDISEKDNKTISQLKVLCKSFDTLYELLLNMDRSGMKLQRIALPVLGSGNQGIETCYIIPPLLKQCIRAFQDIPQLEEVVFCEIDGKKAEELINGLKSIKEKQYSGPALFISYSSAQKALADTIRNKLRKKGIACWMAPYSIPAGSSYQKEIPSALGNVTTVLLILSKEAENSKWVQKEVGCAIGARHRLIPFRSSEYEQSVQFGFLLDGEQIFDVDAALSDDEKCDWIVSYLAQLLCKENQKTDSASQPTASPKLPGHKMNLSFRDICMIATGLAIVTELYIIIKKLK